MSIVATAYQHFDDYVHSGEPIIRQWFLLKSFRDPFFISTVYVLFVKIIGPAMMKNRKPFDLKNLMIVYNLGLVAFYVYFLLRGATYLPVLGWSIFCGELKATNNPLIAKMWALVWQLYIIKYVELLDTVFFILRKKNHMATTLHVSHHALVPVFGFLGMRSETSPYHSVFIAINSIVHVLMYTYYGISVLGPQYQKYVWWKKYLTMLQILQFVFMTAYVAIMGRIGCSTSKFTMYSTWVLSVFFCFMFINYYKKTFVEGGKSRPTANGTTHYKSELNGNGYCHSVANGKAKPEGKTK